MQQTSTLSNNSNHSNAVKTANAPVVTPKRVSVDMKRCSVDELHRRIQEGDVEARHEMVGRYYSIIQATAYKMAKNSWDAEDLAGELYLHVFKVIHLCNNTKTLPGWIKRITLNAFYNKCRKERNQPLNESLEMVIEAQGDRILRGDDEENPANILMNEFNREDRTTRLQKALQSLPEHQRELCDLYYTQCHSFEEIAREKNLALGTIKSRLFRARDAMQRKLGDSCFAS